MELFLTFGSLYCCEFTGGLKRDRQVESKEKLEKGALVMLLTHIWLKNNRVQVRFGCTCYISNSRQKVCRGPNLASLGRIMIV